MRISFRFLRQKGDSVRFVVLDADITFVHTYRLHDQIHSHQDFVRLFQQQPMVCCQVRFALHGVDDNAFGFCPFGGSQFHMAGECGTAHTDNTGRFHLVHDVFSRQLRPLAQCHQIGGPIDRLDPFIPLHVYKDGRTAVAAGIDNRIYLAHFSGHRGVDGNRHEAVCLGQHHAYFHFISFGYDRFGRCADMLIKRKDSLFGQSGPADGRSGGKFVFRWMNSTYLKRFHDILF